MRVLAIDYGDARTGVAFSDPSKTLAGDAFVLHEKNAARLIERLTALISEYGVDSIVVGHPLNMNGTKGERAEKSTVFADKLRMCVSVPVVLWDERRTTVDAHRILHETGHHGKKNKAVVDAVAASLILEGFLGTLKNSSDS